jgi:hypothetical protein
MREKKGKYTRTLNEQTKKENERNNNNNKRNVQQPTGKK